LRRLIEHRDSGCSVPGCHRTHALQIHHIWHWEDGGPTETWNLITLCAFHHARHHEGKLQIEGNADLPRHIGEGVIFRDADGRRLSPAGTPVPPAPGQTAPEGARSLGLPEPRFLPPTGERLDRSGFHLQQNPPEPPHEPAVSPVDLATAEAVRWNRREQQIHRQATGRTGPHPADPTRAGPHA
ncbi:MAG: HNH endonuclease signature motif containing protein, partial [Aquihabitans sp.]